MDDLRQLVNALANALSLVVETYDPGTFGHQRRVAWLARAIGERLGLDQERLEKLYLAGLIHDVGKIALPPEILGKSSRLKDEEMELIKKHPELGFKLLKRAGLPSPIPEVVYEHHERLDGSGYPRGLKGDQILLEARILAVADVVEAISSSRPYRSTLWVDAALEELDRGKGTLYDPQVVEACVEVLSKGKGKKDWLK